MKQRPWWTWAALLVVAWMAWHWLGSHRSRMADEQGQRVLTSHFWVDQLPQDPKQTFHLFAPLRFRGQQVGVVQRRSAYEGCHRIFEWRFKAGDQRLHLRFPQTGEDLALRWKVEPCQRDQFHYHLTLEGFQDYPVHWYTRKSWRTSDLGSLENQVRALTSAR